MLNSESSSLISLNSWIENKEQSCMTVSQFKTNFGYVVLQNKRIAEVNDMNKIAIIP